MFGASCGEGELWGMDGWIEGGDGVEWNVLRRNVGENGEFAGRLSHSTPRTSNRLRTWQWRLPFSHSSISSACILGGHALTRVGSNDTRSQWLQVHEMHPEFQCMHVSSQASCCETFWGWLALLGRSRCQAWRSSWRKGQPNHQTTKCCGGGSLFDVLRGGEGHFPSLSPNFLVNRPSFLCSPLWPVPRAPKKLGASTPSTPHHTIQTAKLGLEVQPQDFSARQAYQLHGETPLHAGSR
jgi:hypothetical protein